MSTQAQHHRAQAKDQFPFLRLPGEIRNMIYEYVGDLGDAIGANNPIIRLQQYHGDLILASPNILLLNRQFAIEALGIIEKKPLNITIDHPLFRTIQEVGIYLSKATLARLNTLRVVLPPASCKQNGLRFLADYNTMHFIRKFKGLCIDLPGRCYSLIHVNEETAESVRTSAMREWLRYSGTAVDVRGGYVDTLNLTAGYRRLAVYLRIYAGGMVVRGQRLTN